MGPNGENSGQSPTGAINNPATSASSASQTDAPKSAMEQFTGLFGFGKKPPVEQPPQPVQASDLNSAGLVNDVTPPATESISSPPITSELKPEDSIGIPVAPLDSSINTVDDLLAQGPQTVEAVAPPEKTPAEKLKQQIADSIDAFLEEVVK